MHRVTHTTRKESSSPWVAIVTVSLFCNPPMARCSEQAGVRVCTLTSHISSRGLPRPPARGVGTEARGKGPKTCCWEPHIWDTIDFLCHSWADRQAEAHTHTHTHTHTRSAGATHGGHQSVLLPGITGMAVRPLTVPARPPLPGVTPPGAEEQLVAVMSTVKCVL